MRKIDELFGFKVLHNQEEKNYEIFDVPIFPQETIQSKRLYSEIERYNFLTRDVNFPLKLDITERVVEVEKKVIEFFSMRDLFNVIERDKNRFINTDTFLKVNLVYENKKSILTIIYYTISSEGTTEISSLDKLQDFIFITFNKKKFTKKFITPRSSKYGCVCNDIVNIPLIPLLWLDYDSNNNLKYFEHFELIEEDQNLPF